jgi:hypothetical protein
MAEAAPGDVGLALVIAKRLVRASDGVDLDWDLIPVTDLDAIVLRLRQLLIGDRVVTDVRCRNQDCGSRIDFEFRISAYVAHHYPKSERLPLRKWSVEPVDAEPGWYRLSRVAADSTETMLALFRLPSGIDQLAVAGLPDAAEALARRCIRPADLPRRWRRRVEAAMEKIAPSLSADVQGQCPQCGGRIRVRFDARQYCLEELRNLAAFVYEDVDALAQRYHWSEDAILAMPNARRASYAELARHYRSA